MKLRWIKLGLAILAATHTLLAIALAISLRLEPPAAGLLDIDTIWRGAQLSLLVGLCLLALLAAIPSVSQTSANQ
ncbi:hypothetical protein [Stratiformator vulcanicus]|uniref:Uncharacterized protein n=1 Tax=Stratiformator vulcanicus TaxID=2527980 RepID=A0A517QZG8_9PLAN|nr:hypothetical protein [Stratiformator vulcanicus]QDT36993.1 hypothetical protein Pan189_13570 [Stratiformator vulcanicus]